jgi:hypothetical protein
VVLPEVTQGTFVTGIAASIGGLLWRTGFIRDIGIRPRYSSGCHSRIARSALSSVSPGGICRDSNARTRFRSAMLAILRDTDEPAIDRRSVSLTVLEWTVAYIWEFTRYSGCHVIAG